MEYRFNNKKPNFFIVGAARAGTTTIYEVLKRHPQVYMSNPLKEPAYFSEYGSKYFVNKNEYLNLFKGAKEENIIGEASTIYLHSEDAPKNIKKFNPNAKIFIQLREPISRAISHYRREIRLGKENLSFKKALEIENYRKNNGESPNFFYFSRGLYTKQVKRFYDNFSENQIFITFYEDFINNPREILFRLCDFLNIEGKFIPEKIPVLNSGNARSLMNIQKILKGNRMLKSILKYIFTEKQLKLFRYKKNYIWKISTTDLKEVIDDDVLFDLKLKYKDDILELQDFLETDLSIWLNKY